MRITVSGARAEFSTGKIVEISKWHPVLTRMRGNSEEARVINNHLDILKSTVLEIENKFVINGEAFDAEDIKNGLLGNNKEGRSLLPIFEDHNAQMEKLIGKSMPCHAEKPPDLSKALKILSLENLQKIGH